MLTSRDVSTSIGLSVGSEVEIKLLVCSQDDVCTLVIGDSVCEIRFDTSSLEMLRDLADDALRKLRGSTDYDDEPAERGNDRRAG